jgi:hypothetical protein
MLAVPAELADGGRRYQDCHDSIQPVASLIHRLTGRARAQAKSVQHCMIVCNGLPGRRAW